MKINMLTFAPNLILNIRITEFNYKFILHHGKLISYCPEDFRSSTS
jgi:hypothetical protein